MFNFLKPMRNLSILLHLKQEEGFTYDLKKLRYVAAIVANSKR